MVMCFIVFISYMSQAVMCVSRQKPRLEAEKLLPRRPRLDVWMPRLGLASPRNYCIGLASLVSIVSSASVLPRLVHGYILPRPRSFLLPPATPHSPLTTIETLVTSYISYIISDRRCTWAVVPEFEHYTNILPVLYECTFCAPATSEHFVHQLRRNLWSEFLDKADCSFGLIGPHSMGDIKATLSVDAVKVLHTFMNSIEVQLHVEMRKVSTLKLD